MPGCGDGSLKPRLSLHVGCFRDGHAAENHDWGATLGPPTSGCSPMGPRSQTGKDGIMTLMGHISSFGKAAFGLVASSRSSHVEGVVPVDGPSQRSVWIRRALT